MYYLTVQIYISSMAQHWKGAVAFVHSSLVINVLWKISDPRYLIVIRFYNASIYLMTNIRNLEGEGSPAQENVLIAGCGSCHEVAMLSLAHPEAKIAALGWYHGATCLLRIFILCVQI